MAAAPEPDRCPLCGSQEFTWGRVMSHILDFKPDDAGFFARNFSATTSMRARRCVGCRNVQLFDEE